MLDVRSLERRWIKYKIKRYFPYIAGVLLIITMLITLPMIWLDTENVSEIKKTPSLSIHTSNQTSTLADANKEQSTVLEPSMDFVKTFETVIPKPAIPSTPNPPITKSIPQSVPATKVLNVPDSSTIKPPLKAPPPSATVAPGDKQVTLNHNNESKLDIESVERRFKETSNPNLGLFIARYYYDHGNYADAYNFALKTNGINNKIDESWIIFSKSLMKLGKVEQAKKTLQLYIGESNSDSARALLDSIERGTFK